MVGLSVSASTPNASSSSSSSRAGSQQQQQQQRTVGRPEPKSQQQQQRESWEARTHPLHALCDDHAQEGGGLPVEARVLPGDPLHGPLPGPTRHGSSTPMKVGRQSLSSAVASSAQCYTAIVKTRQYRGGRVRCAQDAPGGPVWYPRKTNFHKKRGHGGTVGADSQAGGHGGSVAGSSASAEVGGGWNSSSTHWSTLQFLVQCTHRHVLKRDF